MNEIGRKITDKLIEINGSTDFTIAFLPYKRSMWNSMASVYEECIASGADAHCMPIPYYRLKPNHEIDRLDTDFAYFGDIAEDPKGLDDIHPDFIALHYQFEDHNKVTNMLPEYFTGALKRKYNAKMIFLPYGIGFTEEKGVRLYPGIEEMDYIFADSDYGLEDFIVAWRFKGVDFTGRVFPFGSAKYDAVNKPATLPDEWTAIIGDRPLVLVITSLASFLGEPFIRIDKYRRVIDRERATGHAVIFRPHPLLYQTIISMRPDTMAYYNDFIQYVKSLPDVIYDDTEYLERVLYNASYLISDPSSVLLMWQRATKKLYEVI